MFKRWSFMLALLLRRIYHCEYPFSPWVVFSLHFFGDAVIDNTPERPIGKRRPFSTNNQPSLRNFVYTARRNIFQHFLSEQKFLLYNFTLSFHLGIGFINWGFAIRRDAIKNLELFLLVSKNLWCIFKLFILPIRSLLTITLAFHNKNFFLSLIPYLIFRWCLLS